MRKHVSAFKGGRLADAAPPARLINLTVSDVAGDHIDAITDPTVPDSSRAADAIAVLRGHGLWEAIAATIRAAPAGPATPSRPTSTPTRSRPCSGHRDDGLRRDGAWRRPRSAWRRW